MQSEQDDCLERLLEAAMKGLEEKSLKDLLSLADKTLDKSQTLREEAAWWANYRLILVYKISELIEQRFGKEALPLRLPRRLR